MNGAAAYTAETDYRIILSLAIVGLFLNALILLLHLLTVVTELVL